MPSGYASSLLHKKDHTQKRKRSRSRSGGLDGKDDLNYVDDESELSSGDDVLNTSDVDNPHDSHHHTRKRGRPRGHYSAGKEERARSQPSPARTAAQATPTQTYTPVYPSGYVSDFDESGETKVDKYGKLLGGREYRVPTFKLPTRDDTLFMFSKDPAALLGFRDSFVFLKKNAKLIKVHIDNVEKGYLVDANLLRSTFRTREISVVTARSVYKQFGHRIIRKGRKGRDDYYYTEEEDEDDQISEEETPMKEILEKPIPASSFVPVPEVGRNNLAHKLTAQDTMVNELNWMHSAAVSARQFNTSLFSYRRANPTNYDLLTNVYQIPESRQTLRDTGSVSTEENKAQVNQNTLDQLDNNNHFASGLNTMGLDIGFR